MRRPVTNNIMKCSENEFLKKIFCDDLIFPGIATALDNKDMFGSFYI